VTRDPRKRLKTLTSKALFPYQLSVLATVFMDPASVGISWTAVLVLDERTTWSRDARLPPRVLAVVAHVHKLVAPWADHERTVQARGLA